MRFSMLAALIALGACAPAPVVLVNSFDAQAAAYINTPGKAAIQGQAFLRQSGGGVVTCAGSIVNIAPVTTYTSERMTVIYRNTDRGFIPANMTPSMPQDPEYLRHTKRAQCDAQGNFSITGLAAGEYFVVTNVRWTVGYSAQGGSLMQRVVVGEGETKSVILTH